MAKEKELTVDQELSEKAQQMLEARRARDRKLADAKELIRSNYGMLEETLEKELFEALVFAVGNRRGAGVARRAGAGRVSLDTQILNKFKEVGVGGSITDIELFKEFKVGAERMRFFIIKMIKDAQPEDRIWVKFNTETEAYDFVATGPDVPEGWDGYLPKDESIL